jgi:methionyl aminopeptidase
MVTYVNADSAPIKYTGQIKLYGPEGFAAMRKVCAITSECLDALNDIVKPGVTTNEIDRFVFEFGADRGVVPATLNYRGYTKSSCTSINHVVCHGIPDDKPLREGDIVNIDITFLQDGWYGDSSRMYAVGQIKRAAERLMEVTYESLLRGIAAVKPGAKPAQSVQPFNPMWNQSAALPYVISAVMASASFSTMHRIFCTMVKQQTVLKCVKA